MSAASPILPALLALTSAFLFALSDQFSHRGLGVVDGRSGAVASIMASAVAFWLFAPFFVRLGFWLTAPAAIYALVGLFRPALSIHLAILGIARMGPTLASAFSSTSPLWSVMLAILILGEHLTVATALGTLAVMAGVLVAASRPTGLHRDWPVWAISLPIGAAFIRAAGHIGTKIGYADLPEPYFASLVSTTVSAFVAWAIFRFAGNRFKPAPTLCGHLGNYRWFILSGALNGLSIYVLNTALQKGSVVTVMPISAANPVFTLLLALFVFRRETINWRTVLTIALVVPGVILVILR